jgi:hypothetical protein
VASSALRPIIKELVEGGVNLSEEAIEYLQRTLRGFGALENLPPPKTKADLDPAELGATRLPDYAENIEYKTTPDGVLIPEKSIDIADLKGRLLTPAYGDRTYAGAFLDEIGGVKLDQPVVMQGGNQFMRIDDPGVWASEKSAMRTKAKAMGQMEDPLMVYTAMSGQAGDASKMMSDATIGMIEQSKITKEAAKTYDDVIKERVDPDWPGILSTDVRTYLDNMPMTTRRELWQQMDKASFKKMGFPDVGVIRASITDPDLLTVPSFSTGKAISSIDSAETFPSKHLTYNTEVRGDYLGALPNQVPGELVWRDFFQKIGERAKTTGVANPQRAFLMTPSIQQRVDDQMIDEVSQFLEFFGGQTK